MIVGVQNRHWICFQSPVQLLCYTFAFVVWAPNTCSPLSVLAFKVDQTSLNLSCCKDIFPEIGTIDNGTYKT